jgi:hypothetical protein
MYRYSIHGTLDVSYLIHEFDRWSNSTYDSIEDVSFVEIEYWCLRYEIFDE